MPIDDGRGIVFVSDFHMSSGRDDRHGTYDIMEDFLYDGAFGRFVDHIVESAREEARGVRLVVLGDFVDFLQVEPGSPYDIRDTSSAATVAKLGVIARGHPSVFRALARFVDEGHLVDIVLGNHDIEFVWPEVQEAFKELVAEWSQADDTSSHITFHPWMFYVPGVVYAEHGHQHDARNSFLKQLEPFLPSGDRIELPLGSFFVLDLFNEIEQEDPFADNVKPPTRYVGWALANRPLQGLRALRYYRKFYESVMDKTWDRNEAEERKELERYRKEHLRPHAREVDLPVRTVEKIAALAKIPTVRRRQEQRKELLPKPAIIGTLLAGAATIYQVVRRLGSGASFLLALGTVAGAAVFRDWWRTRSTTQENNYLLDTAREVHGLLCEVDTSVPAYVFGHTHNAEKAPVYEDRDSPVYFNSGTWTPIVPQPFDLLATRELFSFVRVERNPNDPQMVEAKLLLWNDFSGRSEKLTRFGGR
jgi:UDP-2,3-diacylglucosamine pyrophosphatase LpxH